MANIVLVYSTPGWAHHHMASDIQRWAPPNYSIRIMSEVELHAITKHCGSESLGKVDAMLHFYWPSASTLFGIVCNRYTSLVDAHGLRFPKPADIDVWESWAASEEVHRSAAVYCLKPLAAVLATNTQLRNEAETFNTNAILCLPGVNTEIFTPDSNAAKPETFTAGWCGARTTLVKCYDEVLTPIRRRDIATWKVHECSDPAAAKSRSEMAEWFNMLDVFVCTSVCEGSPLTVMEAAACGVPVVSTNVGIIKEWPEMHDLGLVVPIPANKQAARLTINEITTRLVRLRDDMAYRQHCSEVLFRSVRKRFDWQNIATRWVRAIAGPERPRGRCKH